MRPIVVLVLLACSEAPADKTDGQTPPGTTPDPTTPETTPDPPPTLGGLEVTCVPTDNALRFVCDVTVDPPQPVQLTYVRMDGLGEARTLESTEVLGVHSFPVYFLAPETVYEAVATADTFSGEAIHTFITGVVPTVVDSRLDMTGTATMGHIGTHLPCTDDAIGVVYDTTTGDLVWYQLLEQGGKFGGVDMLAFTDDHTLLGESVGTVIEVDLMGADLVRLEDLATDFGVPVGGLFGNFHHDITKKNGIYYVLYQEPFGPSRNLDGLILFDALGTELGRWHAEDHLTIPPSFSGDFLHTNAIYVDDAGDFYLSFPNQTLIGKFEGDLASPDFGTASWLLSGKPGEEVVGDITTDFRAIDAPASFSEQHSLILRPDGRIQLLDDDHGRALVLTVDESTSSATVDAAFDTAESSCRIQGTSRSTRAGNPVVGCSGDTVREYDLATEALLWQGTVQCASGPGPGSSRFYPLDGW
jgi:hypothetical protein